MRKLVVFASQVCMDYVFSDKVSVYYVCVWCSWFYDGEPYNVLFTRAWIFLAMLSLSVDVNFSKPFSCAARFSVLQFSFGHLVNIIPNINFSPRFYNYMPNSNCVLCTCKFVNFNFLFIFPMNSEETNRRKCIGLYNNNNN